MQLCIDLNSTRDDEYGNILAKMMAEVVVARHSYNDDGGFGVTINVYVASVEHW